MAAVGVGCGAGRRLVEPVAASLAVPELEPESVPVPVPEPVRSDNNTLPCGCVSAVCVRCRSGGDTVGAYDARIESQLGRCLGLNRQHTGHWPAPAYAGLT